jgi:hypothetical protein
LKEQIVKDRKELELLNTPEESRNLGKMTLEAGLAVAGEYTHSECFHSFAPNYAI